MDEPEAHEALPPRHDPPRRSSSVVPWVLLVVLAVGSFLVAAWLYIDRDGAVEELAFARQQMAELRQVLVDTDELVADLEAGLEDQQEEISRRGEVIAECREALARISTAWQNMADAVEAAGDLDEAEVRSLAARANRHRRAAERAARGCG